MQSKEPLSHLFVFSCLLLLFPVLATAQNTEPSPALKIYRGAIAEAPKTIDPQRAYSVRDSRFVSPCYESLFTYDYLARPAKLIPQLATEIPTAKIQRDDAGKVTGVTYIIHLRRGVRYSEDPCFPGGVGREMTAEDFVLSLKRLADPETRTPVVAEFSRVRGLKAYQESIRTLRKTEQAKEEAYEQAMREAIRKKDYRDVADFRPMTQFQILEQAGQIEGIRAATPHKLELTLEEPYPQFLHWLAMSFLPPLPREAVAAYEPETLNGHAVGTGPYTFHGQVANDDQAAGQRFILKKNPSWWGLTQKAASTIFPEQPASPDDLKSGAWREADAGKSLAFCDRLIFEVVAESGTAFDRFAQGGFDQTGVPAVRIKKSVADGKLASDLAAKGIRLTLTTDLSTHYLAFNMDRDTIGAPAKFSDPELEKNRARELERRRLVRQSLALAIDQDSFHQRFYYGLGLSAQSPLPPGLFGYDPDYRNPARQFDPALTRAKQLMTEAGFENGIDERTGKRLTLSLPSSATQPPRSLYFDFYQNAWAQLGVDLQIKGMPYTRFMNAVHNRTPTYDAVHWGWMMDYPDPENFLFLLHGPNSTKFSETGNNYARYESPRYDELFDAMETMTNEESKKVSYTDIKSGEQKTETLTRLQIIHKMRDVVEHDMPWIPLTHVQRYALAHRWVHNAKPHPMTGPWLKYINIDTEERAKQQEAWREQP